jgi:hypothetical protein
MEIADIAGGAPAGRRSRLNGASSLHIPHLASSQSALQRRAGGRHSPSSRPRIGKFWRRSIIRSSWSGRGPPQ